MPEASILKSRQKRTGIGGYIDNAAYVFDRVSSNTARQLARMQYGPELQRLVKDMVETANQARGDANTFGIELINEFEGRRVCNEAYFGGLGTVCKFFCVLLQPCR
jgi:hypothetical protein